MNLKNVKEGLKKSVEWVGTSRGSEVFEVNGKVMRLRMELISPDIMAVYNYLINEVKNVPD